MKVSAALRVILGLAAGRTRQWSMMALAALGFVFTFSASRSVAQDAYCFNYVSETDHRTGKTFRSRRMIERVLTFPNSKWSILEGMGGGVDNLLLDTADGSKISLGWPFPNNSVFDHYLAEPDGRVIGWNEVYDRLYQQLPDTGRFTALAGGPSGPDAVSSGAWVTALSATLVTSGQGLWAVRADHVEPLSSKAIEPYSQVLDRVLDIPALGVAAVSTVGGRVLIVDSNLDVKVVFGIDAGYAQEDRLSLSLLPDGLGLLAENQNAVWTIAVQGHGPEARPGIASLAGHLISRWGRDNSAGSYGDLFLYWGVARQPWHFWPWRKLWHLDDDMLRDIEGFPNGANRVYFHELKSRHAILISADDAAYIYKEAEGLKLILSGKQPETGKFLWVKDAGGMDLVTVLTTKGLFKLTPDNNLELFSIPPRLTFFDTETITYIPSWDVTLFFASSQLWSIDRNGAVQLVLQDFPHLNLEKLLPLPSGESVFISGGRQGNVVLFRKPGDVNGQCLASAPPSE